MGTSSRAPCSVCGGPTGARNKLGLCTGCRTESFKKAIEYGYEPDPATMERILYYQRRAALGLDLFEESPWARLPGAHQRHLEVQTKLAIATGTITPAYKAKKPAE